MKRFSKVVLSIALVMSILSTTVVAVENNGKSDTSGKTVSTSYAYYNSDQYMWKVSLYVAKSDKVTTDGSTMDDFYQVGGVPMYLTPVKTWGNWVCGARPSNLSEVKFSTSNKVSVLNELKKAGDNTDSLNPINLVGEGSIPYMYVPDEAGNRLPPIPGVNDGYYYGGDTQQQGLIGNFEEVSKFFTSKSTIYNILTGYSTRESKTPEDYVKGLEFTIDGETKKDWDASLILPIENTDASKGNHVQWLLVYEPVSIIYTGTTGYAVTATDISVMQLKKQMDWWYDESIFPDWAGKQEGAWASGGERQNIARLAFLILGNSILTDKTWFGLEASQNIPSGTNPIPDCRWTPTNQLKYGGWGMVRWSNNTSSVSHSTGEYMVKYVSADGTETLKTEYYNTGDKLDEPTIKLAEGCTLQGWYLDKEFTKPVDFNTYVVSGAVDLYAKVVKATENVATVSFETNGGSSIASVKVDKGKSIEAPAKDPEKDGSTFTGWFKDSALTTKYDFRSTVDKDMVLYAGWLAGDITVKYHIDGSVKSTVTTKAGSLLTEPTKPTATNKVFVGWSTSTDYSDVWDFSTDKPTKNLDLYAYFINE